MRGYIFGGGGEKRGWATKGGEGRNKGRDEWWRCTLIRVS